MSARARRVAAAALAAIAVLLLAPVALLASVDAGLLDGAVRAAFGAVLHRKVSFAALRAHLLSREPHLVFSDLRIGQPRSFGAGDLARARSLDLQLRLAPLLVGRLEAPSIRVDGLELHLRRRGPGDDNWTFGRKGGGGASGFLAGTRRLLITPGRVDMDDPQRRLTLQGALRNDPDDARWPLKLTGSGLLKGADYRVTAQASPLNGRPRGAPWPFRATLLDGATRIDMAGVTKTPFDFDVLDMGMAARGPNLADLYYLFGFTPLNSRPYALSARLHAANKRLDVAGLSGRIGNSDVSGRLHSEHPAGTRRKLTGVLHSRVLTAADLKTLLTPLPARKAARSHPGEPSREPSAGRRLFSLKPLSLNRLGAEDLAIDYAVDAPTGFGLSLSDAHAHLVISGGALRLQPLTARLAGGTARAAFSLTPGRPEPKVAVSLALKDVPLSGVTHGKGGVAGALDASLEARGTGGSLAQAAADAAGRASFRLQRGALPRAAAAALGGDLFGMVAAKLGSKTARAGLRCAAGDFDIAGGVMRARRLVVATDTAAATGAGQVDLGRETLALELRPADVGPKPAVRLAAPITISGPIAHPRVGARLSRAKLDVGGLFGALTRPFRKPPAPSPAPPSDRGC